MAHTSDTVDGRRAGGVGDDGAHGTPPSLGDLAVYEQRDLAWEQLWAEAKRLGPDPAFADRDDDALLAELHVRAVEVTTAMARLLDLVAEFTVRGIWADHGARTPAMWLAWQLGIGSSTAREYVRIGLRLRELPLVRARFAAGKLSYSKVRAITRGCVPEQQDTWLQYADNATASELERISSGFRTAQRRRIEGQAEPDAPARTVRTRHLGNGRAQLVLEGPVEEIEEARHRLERFAFDRRREASGEGDEEPAPGSSPSRGATEPPAEEEEAPHDVVPFVADGPELADAAFDALLAGTADISVDTSGLDRHTLVLHAPASALASADGDDAVPVSDPHGRIRSMSAATMRRLACDAAIVAVVTDDGGGPLDIGRRSRKLSAAIRRAVHLRDRTCRYPGCARTRNLHAHHIHHWADGGPTALSNLILLCSYHHGEVHRVPHRIELRPDGRHLVVRGGQQLARLERTASAEALPAVDAAGITHGPPAPHQLRPSYWEGPRTADYDVAVAVLQQQLDRRRPDLVHVALAA